MSNRGTLDKLLSLDGLYEIKQEWFAKLRMDRLCEFLEKKTCIRPNHITLFNFFLGAASLLLVFRYPLAFSVLMVLHFALDNLDGYYARTRKIKTTTGKYIDHAVDFVLGIAFLVVSALYFNQPLVWILLLMFSGEMLIILGMGAAKEKFPSRIFLVFYIFGWYWEGLVAQAIVEPISFLIFLTHRQMKKKRQGRA